MKRHRISAGLMLVMISAISVCAQRSGQPADPTTLERVSVRGRPSGFSVEVVLSRPTVPSMMTLNNPDRLVLDFANTEPGNTQPQRTRVNRGGIREVRIGEDGNNPPTTRVVLDLLQPREYKLVQKQNHVTLIPSSAQTLLPLSPRTNDPTFKAPDTTNGSVASGSVQPGKPSGTYRLARIGSDPTYSPQDPLPVAESSSTEDSLDVETAPPATQFEQPAAALLNGLPLHTVAMSSLLGAPTAMAVAEQGTEQPQIDPKEQKQTTHALLAYSETAPVAAEGTSASEAAPSSVSRGTSASSLPSRNMEDRKLTTPNGADRDFVIGPGDVLAINVWKEPDISRVIPVRSDGKISLPLVGELQAAGQTPRQLEAAISGALKAYIAEPTVAVIVQEIRSRRYNILGQVAKPGSYMLLNSATVLDAIAIAGGFRDFAKKKSIYVLRRTTDGREQRLPFNYTKVIKGAALDQNIPLRPGDTIVVP